MRRRRVILAAALLTILAIAAVVAVRQIEEPLRRHMEQQVNASLRGYRVHIGGLRLHLVGGSLDLLDSTIAQTANPEPPVARIPRLHASVHWRALLHGALVADFWLDRPVLNIDARQAGAEVQSKVPIRQRGWQEAVEHIYPLKIDLFRVTDGDVTYTPARPFAPLHLQLLNVRAGNIRKNQWRDDIATPVDLSGPLVAPRTSTLQAVVGMIRNAYVQAIPPGLDENGEQPAP